jgi:hypothetical protein
MRSILSGLKTACLLNRLTSTLGISEDLSKRRTQDPVWRMLGEADRIQAESIAKLRASKLCMLRREAALMEKLYPGYTAELNKQRASVGLQRL